MKLYLAYPPLKSCVSVQRPSGFSTCQATELRSPYLFLEHSGMPFCAALAPLPAQLWLGSGRDLCPTSRAPSTHTPQLHKNIIQSTNQSNQELRGHPFPSLATLIRVECMKAAPSHQAKAVLGTCSFQSFKPLWWPSPLPLFSFKKKWRKHPHTVLFKRSDLSSQRLWQ